MRKMDQPGGIRFRESHRKIVKCVKWRIHGKKF